MVYVRITSLGYIKPREVIPFYILIKLTKTLEGKIAKNPLS